MDVSDTYLLSRVAERDTAAFATFYDRYAPRAFGLILHFLKNQTDAEDVLQETFLQVWNQAGCFDDSRSCAEAWLLLLARSRALDRLRRRKLVTNQDVPEGASHEDAHAPAERNEAASCVRAALGELPRDQKELIELAFFGGLTHHEIAARLQLPLGTVKTRIRAGMMRLRERLPSRKEMLA